MLACEGEKGISGDGDGEEDLFEAACASTNELKLAFLDIFLTSGGFTDMDGSLECDF